jgi:hypothetical protein
MLGQEIAGEVMHMVADAATGVRKGIWKKATGGGR